MPRPLNPSERCGSSARAEWALERREHEWLVSFFRSRSPRVEDVQTPILPKALSAFSGRPLSRRPRALVLDVYGTLLASAAGELGPPLEASDRRLGDLQKVLGEYGIPCCAVDFEAALKLEVLKSHERSRRAGISYPEIDAAEIFSRVSGKSLPEARRLGAARESVLYPASPMPGARELLKAARQAGLALGIVSNAQYYTPPILEASFGSSLRELGFEDDLCVWSWRLGRAKPDVGLFRALSDALAARGIPPAEAVYVGNDLLNDILPAQVEGYRTALFAGDSRSLRLRSAEEGLEGVLPDTVLSSFHGAPTVLRLGSRGVFGS